MRILQDDTEGKRFGQMTIVLFSNLGGAYSAALVNDVVKGLKTMGIELNVM